MGFRNRLSSAQGPATAVDTGGAGQRVVVSQTAGQEGGGAVLLYPNTVDDPGWLEAGTSEDGRLVSLSSPPRFDGRRSQAVLTSDGGIYFSTPGPIYLDGSETYARTSSGDLRSIQTNAGTSGVLAGAAPPAGTPLQVKAATGTVPVNASGDGTIVFPGGAFANGVVHVDVTHYAVGAPSNNIEFIPWGITLTKASVRAYLGTAPLANLSIPVTLTAYGW